MSKSQKTALLKNLLEKAKRETDVKYIYCSKEEKPLIKANNVTTVDISGGIIVENSDKTIRIDYSYETIMENIYDKIMQDVAETLF